ncbi:MAG: DUF1573 domain-containing protein [Victivallales bacterium]|nr:DUF1573 domain-containing protein [Victivallales bacterium]
MAHEAEESEADELSLPASPLAVLNASSLLDVNIYSTQIKELSFQLTNAGEKEVLVREIRSGCMCIQLKNPPANFTLAPKQTCTVELSFYGRNLPIGSFRRAVVVQAKGYAPLSVIFTGMTRPAFYYEPAQVIALDNFLGTVPWKRTFTIRSLLPDDKIKLNPPKESGLLQTKLSQAEPGVFQLEVAPKNVPMPRGPFKEIFRLALEKDGFSGEVEVAVTGVVVDYLFEVEATQFALQSDRQPISEPFLFVTKVIPGKHKSTRHEAYHRKKSLSTALFPMNTVTVLPVAALEETVPVGLQRKENWTALLPDFSVKVSDGTLKPALSPSDNAMFVTVPIPANYFDQVQKKIALEYYFRGKLFGTSLLFRSK